MSRKPIIEIDVQDEKFQRFLQAYGEFTDSLGDIPKEWKRVDAAVSGSGKKMTALGAKAAQSLGLSARNAKKLDQAIKAAANSTQTLGKHAKGSSSGFDKLKKSAEGAGKVIHRIVGLTGRLGKLSLGIAGIGGAASLWGIAELAHSALGRQRSALGAGVSTGTLAAWKTYLSPALGNPESLLNRVAVARQSPADRWWLTQVAPNWQKEGIGQTSAQLLLNAQSFMKKYKSSGVALSAAGARGYLQAFGGDPTTLIRLQGMSRKALLADIHNAQAAAPSMGFNRKTGAEWTSLSVQLHGAGVRIETALLNALAPLAPAIKSLSIQIVGWIDKMLGGKNASKLFNEAAKGIKEFAKYVGSKDFEHKMHEFVHALSVLAHAAYDAAKFIEWMVGGNTSKTPVQFSRHQKNVQYTQGGVYMQHRTHMPHAAATSVSLGSAINQAATAAANAVASTVHVHIQNDTHARVDVMTQAAASAP